MPNFVGVPLIFMLATALLGGRVLRSLRPRTAARASTVLLACVLVAAVPTVWIIGLSGLAHVGFHHAAVDWSYHLLPGYGPIGTLIGAVSLLAAIIGTYRAATVLLLHRRLRCTDTCPFEMIDTDEVFAYTLPGPAATIAVSSGLRRTLTDAEFEMVIAHEQAHARHRHDRLLLLALLTQALVPIVRPLVKQLEYSIERWADEEALEGTGVDRRLGARTIAKVALATATPSVSLGIATHGVAARAAALLDPVQETSVRSRLATFVLVALTVALAGFQIHHTLLFGTDLVG